MSKTVDKNYCMSSFLTLRYIIDPNRIFADGVEHEPLLLEPEDQRIACDSAQDIDRNIQKSIDQTDLSHAALLLSGGIDSGILASYMPKGAKAYTVHNESKLNDLEVERAAKICEANGLEHVVVEVSWDDYDAIMDELSVAHGCPVFGNEPQVYYVVKRAKDDGHDTIVFGDSADLVFGGMDKLLSKDWKFEEFIDRYTFLDPAKVLKHPVDMTKDVYEKFRVGDGIDTVNFLKEIFSISSGVAYYNALHTLEMKYLDPFSRLRMAKPLDLKRVRNGESKYLLRDLYRMKYPSFEIPEKIPMARPMDFWMKDWEGPVRDEFLPNCVSDLTGEQKYLVYSLERFLNAIER